MFRDPGEVTIFILGVITACMVCVVLVKTLRRRSAQHALESRLHFENVISEVSRQFMNVPIDRMDGEFSQAMERLAPLLHVDGIILLEFAANNTELLLTRSHEGGSGSNAWFRIDDFAWYSRKLLKQEEVLIDDVDRLPEEAEYLKITHKSLGVVSSFSIPLKASGKIVGALVFSSNCKGIEWPPLMVDQCRLLGGVFAAGLLRKRAACALGTCEHMNQSVRELSGKLIRAQEEERSRIARELHDDICQQLALLAIDLQRIQDGDSTGTRAKQRLSTACKKVDQISTDVHNLSHRIHSTKLDYLGLVPALRRLCDEFSQEYDVDIECHFQGAPANLDADISLSLFRVAQEALSNVTKHSSARHSLVELNGTANELVLRVSDDGVGFDVDSVCAGNHLGLGSMQERLRAAGGVLTIRSNPSFGTQIEARLPMRERMSGWEATPGSAAAA